MNQFTLMYFQNKRFINVVCVVDRIKIQILCPTKSVIQYQTWLKKKAKQFKYNVYYKTK
jgi:transketolase N-terminal domain/subunit